MIRLLLILALLFPSLSLAGQGMGPGPGVKAYSAATPTYIVEQGFEGTGYETGGNDGTWATSMGTPDPDYATSPLEGSQSLMLDGCVDAADTRANMTYTAGAGTTDELYFLLKINAVGGGSSGIDGIASMFNGGTTLTQFYVKYLSATTYQLVVDNIGGGTEVATSAALTVGSTYHVWASFAPGGGTDAVGTIAFSSDGTRPTSGNNFAQQNGGTGTLHVNRVLFQGEYTSGTDCFDLVYDKVKTDDETIGSNP